MNRIGVVAIGRNEGERLPRCLRSVLGDGRRVVYVDSASRDGSEKRARDLGVETVSLDPAGRLGAARARNAGFRRLLEVDPSLEAIQFVDGDCELAPGWLERATAALARSPRTGAVFGRLRERHPERSVYNRLCDQEWNVPVGPSRHFPGNAMVRTRVLRETGGYAADLIAGEEPELSIRARRAGWEIARLDCEMGLHDAAITRLAQWLRRAYRAGYASAELFRRHGAPPERAFAREQASALAWGALLPAVALGAAFASPALAALLGLGYPALALRVYRARRRLGALRTDAALYAVFCVLAKLPQAAGALRSWLGRAALGPAPLIEYK
jgi:GT2 family glycosyltransferase